LLFLTSLRPHTPTNINNNNNNPPQNKTRARTGAIYEMLDLYKNAPYKQRGSIPFGMQRGGYLTTEEKIRRKWLTYAGDGAASAALAKAGGDLSYGDLVASFETVCTAMADGTPLDLTELARDETLLGDAVALARENVIQWVARQDALLAKAPAGTPQFVFRVSDEKVVTGHAH